MLFQDISTYEGDSPMIDEQWKTIRGYEGYYEVSSYGNVRSLNRMVTTSHGVVRHMKGKVLAPYYNKEVNESCVPLSVDGIRDTGHVRQLVWDHFGDRKRDGHLLCVINIDGDGNNNHIDNLKLSPKREAVHRFSKEGVRSKYLGVKRSGKKWCATTNYKGKDHWIGVYNTEEEASAAYKTVANIIDHNRGYKENVNE